MSIKITVNGAPQESEIESRELLVQYLRDRLGLTGTHIGCVEGRCGCCTVVLDGKAVKSCLVFAVQCDGSEVLTIEGLARNGALHPLQRAFMTHHALQCGFCTPGMIMSAYELLMTKPKPTEAEIVEGMAGNLCRCTGYLNIVKAVKQVATEIAGAA